MRHALGDGHSVRPGIGRQVYSLSGFASGQNGGAIPRPPGLPPASRPQPADPGSRNCTAARIRPGHLARYGSSSTN